MAVLAMVGTGIALDPLVVGVLDGVPGIGDGVRRCGPAELMTPRAEFAAIHCGYNRGVWMFFATLGG